MAYIPTIHTFEDDINENKEENISSDNSVSPESSSNISYNKSNNISNIIVPAEEPASLTKKILTLASIIFILSSLSLVGYFLYSKYKTNNLANVIDNTNINTPEQNTGNDLNKIFPSLAAGISPYIKESTQNGNIIILSIKDNSENGIDNYSLLYAYILAHPKDLGRDLVNNFNLNDLEKNNNSDLEISTTTNTNENNSSSTISSSTTESTSTNISSSSDNVLQNLGNNINNIMTTMSKPTLISGDKLIWETKTINNQDVEIANAGIINLFYGYKNQKYIIFTTSLKDFFDTLNKLN